VGNPDIRRRSIFQRSLAVTMTVAAALGYSACAKASSEEAARVEPAKVVKVKGSSVTRVVLTAHAAKRLGITTAPVGQATVPGGAKRLTVPYSAVIYDAEGNAFVYTNPAPLVFVRAPITVDVIDGSVAYLLDGPAAGTAVATVGVPELYGVDAGVGGNE
jgi:hypothetical protein